MARYAFTVTDSHRLPSAGLPAHPSTASCAVRLIGWIWRRWGNWQSVVAILDALDLKTWALGILTVGVTILWGVLYNEMTPIQIYLYALGAGAFGCLMPIH